MAKQFIIQGTAVIKKIQVSAAARKQLQNLVVNINTQQAQQALNNLANQIQNVFKPLVTSSVAGARGLQRVANQFNNVANAAQGANATLKKTDSLFLQVLRKASAFRVSTIVINSFFNAISSAITFTLEFDSALRDINKILLLTDDKLAALGSQLISIAKDFNLTAQEVAEGSRVAAQAGVFGINASEAEKTAATLSLVTKAAILGQTSTLKFADALDTLITVSKQTNVSIAEAAVTLAKFSVAEDVSAVDAKELAEVFKRAGTSISQAFGANIDGAIASMTALLERTRQGGAVVGTFAKTLIARLSGANAEATNAFKSIGIEISNNLTGNLKDPLDLLIELREKIKGLGGEDVGEILGKIGGIRQIELFKALLETLPDSTNKFSRTGEIQGALSKGISGQILKAEQDSAKLSARLNELTQSFNQFVDSLKNSALVDYFEGGIKALTELLDLLRKGSSGGLLGSLVAGSAGAVAAAGAGGLIRRLFGPAGGAAAGATGAAGAGAAGTTKAATGLISAFSVKLLATAAAVTTLGTVMQSSSSDIAKSVGSFLQTMGPALAFGPKFAGVVGLLATLAPAISSTVAAIKVAFNPGDLSATLSFYESELADNLFNSLRDGLSAIGIGNRNVDKQRAREGAEEVRLRQQSDLFRAGQGSTRVEITDKNRVQAERLAALLTGAVTQISDSSQDIFQKVRDGIDDVSLEDAKGVIQKKVQDFIGNELKDGTFDQLRDLLTNKEFLGKLPEELAAIFKSLKLGSAGLNKINLAEALIPAISDFAQIKSFRTEGNFKPAFSKEQLDEDRKLITDRTELLNSTYDLLQAERKLFDVRSGESLASIEALVRLEQESGKAKEDQLQREANLIRERAKINLERKLAQEGDAISRLSKELELLLDNGEFSSIKISELNNQILTLKDASAATAVQLSKIGSGPEREDIEAVERELLRVRLDNIKSQFDAISRLSAAEKQLQLSRISQSADIADALLDEQDAAGKLRMAIVGPSQTDDVESSRIQLEYSKKSSQIRIAALSEEIDLLNRLQKTSIETRRLELTKALEAFKASPDAGTVEGKGSIKAIQKELDAVSQSELQVSEEINRKVIERSLLETKARSSDLNGLIKVIESERKLREERLDGARKLLDTSRALKDSNRSIFEAQKGLTDAIRSKLEEAAQEIRDKRSALSSALDQLASARKSLIDALRQGADAFADFNLELAKAQVAADKVLGKFFGLKEEAGALSIAFESVIDSAAAAGASEQKLAELRAEAAKEQLEIFSRLLGDQRSKAQQFFTSSAEDRINFVEGLAAASSVTSQFGGDIGNFRGLSESQLNQFGAALISLPQEVRQNITGALDLLPDNVGIGGLTKDEVLEVLQGGSLGESQSTGIERLSDTIQTVADLTRQAAELNRSQLISSQQSLVELQRNVGEAKEQVLIAKNALAQAQIDAQKTQGAIAEVNSTLNTQIGQYRDEFKAKADLIIASTKDPLERQIALTQLLVDFQREIVNRVSATSSLVGSVTPDSRIGNMQGVQPLPSSIAGPGTPAREVIDKLGRDIVAANSELRSSIDGLKSEIQNSFITGTAKNTEAIEKLSFELAQTAIARENGVKAELNIDNTQKINISGATEIVQKVLAALDSRGFVTQEQLSQIEKIVGDIIRNQIESGIARPGFAIK